MARAAPEARTGGNSRWRGAVNFSVCAFRRSASPHLFEGEPSWLSFLLQSSGADALRGRFFTSSLPGIAVRRTASLRSPMTRQSMARCRSFVSPFVSMDHRVKPGGDEGGSIAGNAQVAAAPPHPTLSRTRGEGAASVSLIVSSSASVLGRIKKKGTRRAKTQRARSHIAEISRSVLRRPGTGRAGLLRLFRLLARLPLSAVPARARLPRR